jgi:predicted nucleotidyltransferase
LPESSAVEPLPPDFSADAVAAIRRRLDAARNLGVSILLAIESGSRAWGFPSPDSDYDCRFLYVRPLRDHVVLQPQRDVIEFPVEGIIDAGGWDLRKAILLALAGNAVVVEWAKSPYTYEERPGFRPRFLDLLAQIVDPAKVARHYLGLARAHLSRVGNLSGDVKLKKLFYLIRPIVALDWMEARGFRSLPPMNLVICLDETELPAPAAACIARMIEEKKRTREMGEGPVPSDLARYLEARYGHHEMNMPATARDAGLQISCRSLADDFYRREVMQDFGD